jgi:hypothetical protein
LGISAFSLVHTFLLSKFGHSLNRPLGPFRDRAVTMTIKAALENCTKVGRRVGKSKMVNDQFWCTRQGVERFFFFGSIMVNCKSGSLKNDAVMIGGML